MTSQDPDPKFIRSLEKEEKSLLAELEKIPMFQQFQAIRKTLDVYRAAKTNVTQPHVRPLSPKTRHTFIVGAALGAGKSLNAQIIAGAAAFLREAGRRAQSREIVLELENQGIEIPGEKKSARVSSSLSSSPLFDNVAGEGYGLTEWSATEGTKSETPDSGKLSGASKNHGLLPLN